MQQVAHNYSNSWQEPNELPLEPRVKRVVRTGQYNQYRKVLVKCGLLVFAYAILLVFLSAKSASLGYQIDNLNKDINNITTDNSRLEYQIAQLSAPSRIERLATTELGMQTADLKNSIAMKVEPQPIKVASRQNETTNISQKPLHKIYTSLSHLAQNSF